MDLPVWWFRIHFIEVWECNTFIYISRWTVSQAKKDGAEESLSKYDGNVMHVLTLIWLILCNEYKNDSICEIARSKCNIFDLPFNKFFPQNNNLAKMYTNNLER